jgi:DNA-binding beta-propeller fold protein YncE
MNARKFWFAIASPMLPLLVAGTLIDGPRLGVVFDSAQKALRPILGIPGAATLGQPVGGGLGLRKIAISQSFVLATQGEHNQVVVLSLTQTPLTAVVVPGADRGPDELVLSAGGQAAVLYYKKERNLIQVLSGLPASPKVSAELYLSAGQSPSALAVSDDGKTVLAGAGSKVVLVTGTGEVPVFSELGSVAAITSPVAGTAFIADGGHNQIYRVRGLGGNMETDVVAGSKQGISSPVAVAVSHDGSRAFVANSKSETISIIELEGQVSVTKIACGCTPTGLSLLSGGDVFRLTEPSSRPMWVMDASAREARVLFVPPDLAGGSQK